MPHSKKKSNKIPKNEDFSWMAHALDLAARGNPQASPNPLVGACVVKSGRLVGEGWHEKFGAAHAEVEALRQAGQKAAGATLYVTLEPCSTWGKTPPCVQSIVQSGVSRVVIAASDPNPVNGGKAAAILRAQGISVTTGVLSSQALRQNESFVKWATTGLPFVTLKMAQSLDGKIAAVSGQSRWISGPEARRFVHALRQNQDAVLVGKKTVLADDPELNIRYGKALKNGAKPWRVIVDPDFQVSDRNRVFQGSQLTLRVVSKEKISRRQRASKVAASQNLLVVKERRGRLDFHDLLVQLGALGVARLLVEGGGETAWSFLSGNWVDRIFWIVAPKIVGGREAVTSVEGEGVQALEGAFQPRQLTCRPLGRDWLFEGVF